MPIQLSHQRLQKMGLDGSCLRWSLQFKETLKSLQPADIVPDPDISRIMLRDADDFWVKIDSDIEQSQWFITSTKTLKLILTCSHRPT